MSQAKSRRKIEIRFSLFSLISLMACWLGITLLAFFLGSMMGRMQQMNESKHRYAVPEHAVPDEDLPVLTFDEALAEPDITLNQLPLPSRDSGGRQKAEGQASTPEVPSPAASSADDTKKVGKPENGLDKPENGVDKAKKVAEKPKSLLDKPTKKGTRRVIQIASFKEKNRAESLVEKLKKRGYKSFLSVSDSSAGGEAYFRVFVGPFADMEETLAAKKALEGKDKIKNTFIRQEAK